MLKDLSDTAQVLIFSSFSATYSDFLVEIIMERDSRLRSIMKAITWRFIATSITFILAFSIFSNTGCEGVLEKSLLVAASEMVIKMVVYYAHERVWQKIPVQLLRKFVSTMKS